MLISRQGGCSGRVNARSSATRPAIALKVGGHGDADTIAVIAPSASPAMLYFARMAQEARLQLTSAYENIELAEGVLQELCSSTATDEETVYWIGMALREALANAIKHGNKLNPDRCVLLEMRVTDGGELSVVITDEGDGFDAGQVVDPTSPGNILRTNGRGIFYMRQFMDAVDIRPSAAGGTVLSMTKTLKRRM
ncbi:MAG: ATP-binding protein [Acidobacteria bacterium]|nr:ATP-binding protein [Acidobacteriota bacterium]